MKKIMQLLLSISVVAVMAFSMTACNDGGMDGNADDEQGYEQYADDNAEGEDDSQTANFDGTWIYQSLNGVDYEELCAQNNLDPATAGATWVISGNSITTTTSSGSTEGTIEITENGFIYEIYNVTYDSSTDTISWTLSTENGDVVTVMKRA